MDSYPPPKFPPPGPAFGPTPEPPRRRWMSGGVALLAVAVAAGGLIVGSRYVAADRPSIATTSAASLDDPPEPGDAPIDDESDRAPEPGDAPIDDESDRAPEPGPLGLPDFEEFEEFERCLDEQLGPVLDELDELGNVWHGSVVVENLGGEGEDAVTVYDFGEGDATVVVTKSGDTIDVETSGDVATFDISVFGADEADWDAAHEACADLLPDDLGFPHLELGEEFHEMFEELPFEELFDEEQLDDLGRLFEELPFEELFDEEQLDDLGRLFEEHLDDLGRLFDDAD